jgi:hypothetical protein
MDASINIIKNLTLIKSIEHKSGKSLKKALDHIVILSNKASIDISKGYQLAILYFDFDTFAQLKELYSTKTYKFIPEWKTYFEFNKICSKCIKKNNDPIRLFFIAIKSAESPKDNKIRSPYYINLDDIDYAGYYKLFKYLILSYYDTTNRINATKFSIFGQKAAIETNCAYIIRNNRIIKSIEQCIESGNEDGIQFLIEELSIKPTWNQLNKIESNFNEYLLDLATYYFE